MCRGWGDAEAWLLCSSCLSRQLLCPDPVPAALGHNSSSLSRFLVPSILSFRPIIYARKQHPAKNAPKTVPVAWDNSLQLKNRGQHFPESSTSSSPWHKSSLVFSPCCLEACHMPSLERAACLWLWLLRRHAALRGGRAGQGRAG